MQVEVLFYPVGQFPPAWEVKELSNINVCPVIGPFKQGHHGPSTEFFEKLNRIQYMWMPGSDRHYNPPDSPESSLLDLFGSSTLAGGSIASVVECVARAHMDDDSVDTDSASIHVDSDGTVTSIC